MIYINTSIPIEELSKIQEQYDKEKKMKVIENYVAKHKEHRLNTHREWAKINTDHLAVYREENRDKIRAQYKKHKLKVNGAIEKAGHSGCI
jgi:predicted flavoprotein YhiN